MLEKGPGKKKTAIKRKLASSKRPKPAKRVGRRSSVAERLERLGESQSQSTTPARRSSRLSTTHRNFAESSDSESTHDDDEDEISEVLAPEKEKALKSSNYSRRMDADDYSQKTPVKRKVDIEFDSSPELGPSKRR